MPVATLTFNLPEENQEFQEAVKSSDYLIALQDIGNEVFRPARKHGYDDAQLNKLIESINQAVEKAKNSSPEFKDLGTRDVVWDDTPTDATDLIRLLEERFYKIIQERNIELW